MKSDINDLCEAFLAALTNAGYAVKSIENYKQVSNRFKKFCAENGYDTYTVNIGQIFADNVFNEETGAFVGYRNVMYGRFVRLINSFYLQGTFDFSMVTKEKNLPKSIHLIEIYQDYMEHLKTQYPCICCDALIVSCMSIADRLRPIHRTGTAGIRSPQTPFFHRGRSAGLHC